MFKCMISVIHRLNLKAVEPGNLSLAASFSPVVLVNATPFFFYLVQVDHHDLAQFTAVAAVSQNNATRNVKN